MSTDFKIFISAIPFMYVKKLKLSKYLPRSCDTKLRFIIVTTTEKVYISSKLFASNFG